ncbi:MAG: hypothetical protein ACLSG5_07085 [Oscillospiraceae bacterium]
MQFFSTVCMAARASALFRMLIPENRFAKQISLLTAGLFILAGVNALRGTDFDLGAVQYSYEDSADYIGFSGDVNRELQKKICSEMSDKVYALLNEQGICPEEVHIAVNISGLYSISITRWSLYSAETTLGGRGCGEVSHGSAGGNTGNIGDKE